jgi:hypothetical protein
VKNGYRTELLVLVALAVLTASMLFGCVVELPPYELDTPMPTVPQLEHKLDLEGARVEFEATATPVRLVQVASGSFELRPGRSGEEPSPAVSRELFLSAYCTNTSWRHPALGFGEKEPTLRRADGRTIAWNASDSRGSSAVYKGTSTTKRILPPWREGPDPRAVPSAQFVFNGECEVPSGVATYTCTWDLGAGRVASFDFRF